MKMSKSKIELDMQIDWKSLVEILENNKKATGIISRFWYYFFGYGHYAPLANFAIEVINTYQLPYDELKKL